MTGCGTKLPINNSAVKVGLGSIIGPCVGMPPGPGLIQLGTRIRYCASGFGRRYAKYSRTFASNARGLNGLLT
jgi:hypothetical protein